MKSNIFSGIKTLVDKFGITDEHIKSPIGHLSLHSIELVRYLYENYDVTLEKVAELGHTWTTINQLEDTGLIVQNYDDILELTHKGKSFLMLEELNTHEYSWIHKDDDKNDVLNEYYKKRIHITKDKYLTCYIIAVELGKEYVIIIRDHDNKQIMYEEKKDITDEQIFRLAERRLKQNYIPVSIDLLDFMYLGKE